MICMQIKILEGSSTPSYQFAEYYIESYRDGREWSC